ncbi:MAG: LysM domain-containing protein [Cyanobacteriota bacterium]
MDVAPASRYAGLVPRQRIAADGSVQTFLPRRLIPAPERFTAFGHRRLSGTERIDDLASEAYGDPELYWRLADALPLEDPADLLGQEGRRIPLPLPLEVSDRGLA